MSERTKVPEGAIDPKAYLGLDECVLHLPTRSKPKGRRSSKSRKINLGYIPAFTVTKEDNGLMLYTVTIEAGYEWHVTEASDGEFEVISSPDEEIPSITNKTVVAAVKKYLRYQDI